MYNEAIKDRKISNSY